MRGSSPGWWVLIGDMEHDEVVSLKRVSMADTDRRVHVRLRFPTPAGISGEFELTLFVISEAWIGIDQQQSVALLIKQ
jgi:hypothetical protein